MRNSTSACTSATASTTRKTIKRPMSTSIIPSLSLAGRPSIMLKRTSTPQKLSIPKRPASTSQSALASSQSQIALNLLGRTSNQNSNPSSIRSPDHSPLLIRDFGFKSNDPKHLGQKVPKVFIQKTLDESKTDEELFWAVVPRRQPEPTLESELQRDQEEAEQSIEIDRLINQSRENALLASTATPSVATFASTCNLSPPTISSETNIIEIGEHHILTKLSSKYENFYVSLYDFQAEGESEMNLSKGEIVKVLEIICDGWVVARKTRLEINDEGDLIDHELCRQVSLDDLSHFELPNDDHSDDLYLTGLCPENFLCKIS